MLPRFVRLTMLTAFLGLLSVPAAHASTHVFVQIGIPAPVVVAPVIPAPVVAPPVYGPPVYAAPYPGYVWRAGYYVRTVYGPRWIPGAWVPRAYYYGRVRHVGPRWDHRAYVRHGWRR